MAASAGDGFETDQLVNNPAADGGTLQTAQIFEDKSRMRPNWRFFRACQNMPDRACFTRRYG
jgi:hypothetical protein